VGSNPECHRKVSAACRGDAAHTAGAAMPKYDYRFLDLVDNIAMVELVERDDDGAASDHANALLNRHTYHAIEVWHSGRRVHRVKKPRRSPLAW
jgi:hypothetical protein